MDFQRIARHLVATPWRVRRAFTDAAMAAIGAAIKESEATHSGEIRFAVEGALESGPLFAGQSARERAIDVFSQLRIWDTDNNNGVLIYLLLADRDVEIVADRGIHAKVGAAEWEAICHTMESAFREGHFSEGVLSGIRAVTRHLAAHFPAAGANSNELPNRPVVL